MLNVTSTLSSFLPFLPYNYRGEAACCDLCGTSRNLTIARYDRRLKPLRTVVCHECGLVRTDPMPTDAELTDYYAHGYRLDYQLASTGPPRFHRVRSDREAQQRLDLLRPVLKPNARVLDFGSGSGEFLAHAKAAGHPVLGIEPGKSYAAFAMAMHGVPVIDRPWQEVELPAGSFDLITASHVLEHLRHPVAALRQLAHWLADEGVLHVAVPDVLTRPGHGFQHFHFAHVYNFSPKTLVWAGLAAGLEVDHRVAPVGTSIVFRKRAAGPVSVSWLPQQGPTVAARFQDVSPVGFLLSGRWIGDALRRWRKAWLDSQPRLSRAQQAGAKDYEFRSASASDSSHAAVPVGEVVGAVASRTGTSGTAVRDLPKNAR